MKYIILISLFSLQLNSALAQDFAVGDTIYVSSDTYLRPEPTFSSKKDTVALMPKGTIKVVNGVSSDGKYVNVDMEKKTGWLYFSYIFPWSVVKEDFQRKKKAEEKRKNYIQFLRDNGYGIKLESMGFSTNSADGVTPTISFENVETKKTIKYISFTFTPYNTVGDLAYGRINEQSTRKARGVGPIIPGERTYYSFDNFWYNGTIGCIEVRKIQVEYMDGSSFIYVNDLKDISKQARNINLRGGCRDI